MATILCSWQQLGSRISKSTAACPLISRYATPRRYALGQKPTATAKDRLTKEARYVEFSLTFGSEKFPIAIVVAYPLVLGPCRTSEYVRSRTDALYLRAHPDGTEMLKPLESETNSSTGNGGSGPITSVQIAS